MGPAAGVVSSASGAATASAPAKSPAAFAKMPPRPLVITPEDETAARVTLHKTLPSGLPAVAATSASHHLLAIDSAGTLFLSEDSGVVWEPIPQPWTGHATELRFSPAAPGPPAAIAGAAPADAASGAAYAPLPAFFEIVTESGIHWTSTDGRTWKTK
jgi:hypothetical protein